MIHLNHAYQKLITLVDYYWDNVIDDVNENNDAGNYRININKTTTSKSFEYKTKIIGSSPADSNTLDTEIVVPSKYCSNFWKSLDLPLINSEIEFDLPLLRKYVISEKLKTAVAAVNPSNLAREEIKRVSATLQIISDKLYAPVVTLFIQDNIKLLENIKQGFKGTNS